MARKFKPVLPTKPGIYEVQLYGFGGYERPYQTHVAELNGILVMPGDEDELWMVHEDAWTLEGSRWKYVSELPQWIIDMYNEAVPSGNVNDAISTIGSKFLDKQGEVV